MYYFNVCAIIYLTSEGYFFDKRFKTLLSIAPFVNIALFIRLFLFIGKILERSCIRFIDLDIKFLDHHNLNEEKIIWNIIA